MIVRKFDSWEPDTQESKGYNIITYLEDTLIRFGLLKEYSSRSQTINFDRKYKAQQLQSLSEDEELYE